VRGGVEVFGHLGADPKATVTTHLELDAEMSASRLQVEALEQHYYLRSLAQHRSFPEPWGKYYGSLTD